MFSYTSKTNDYINQEITVRLGELTAAGQIKSELEYKKTINDILSSIRVDLGRVTNPTKYIANSVDIVSSTKLNDLFRDLESDLRILHAEVRDAHKVLDMSLERNVTFYRRIKSKIASMWKEIAHFRETSFNIESADYTFFESFDTENSVMDITGLVIDKKTGVIHLTPSFTKAHNESKDIREVKATIMPTDNKEGGVFDTTNPGNKIVRNYTVGDRSMLKDGLWKTQLLTSVIPTVSLDIFAKGSTNNYNGVVIYLDITFAGVKLINEIGFDPYGEFRTSILGVRYRRSETSSWEQLTTTNDDNITTEISGSNSDWIYFRNINPVNAKSLRIIVFQENYNNISKLLSSVDTMVDKVVRDLVEKRYQKLTYTHKYTDKFPEVESADQDRGSLYNEVMNVIEQEKDVETLGTKVTELLVPAPVEINQDIQDWKVYNLGAWSIEPKTVKYAPNAKGIYVSHDLKDKESGFRLDEGAPTEATLYTRQDEPNGTLVEWYLLADNGTVQPAEIPIIPNNDRFKTESVTFGDYYPLEKLYMRGNKDVKNISKVIKLDFPIHPAYLSELIVYENGIEILNANSSTYDSRGLIAESYNSTEIYLSDLNVKPGNRYAIKYVPALLDIVKCWTLRPLNSHAKSQIDIGAGFVFATQDAARYVGDNIINLQTATYLLNNTYVRSDKYEVKQHLCTKFEYDRWFQDGEVGVFVDKSLYGDKASILTDALQLGVWFDENWTSDVTKVSWLYDDTLTAKPYSDDSSDASTWSSLISAPPQLHVNQKHYTVRKV